MIRLLTQPEQQKCYCFHQLTEPQNWELPVPLTIGRTDDTQKSIGASRIRLKHQLVSSKHILILHAGNCQKFSCSDSSLSPSTSNYWWLLSSNIRSEKTNQLKRKSSEIYWSYACNAFQNQNKQNKVHNTYEDAMCRYLLS